MKAWRSVFAVGLLLAGLITSSVPLITLPTASAVGNCPNAEIQGSSATPGAEDTNKCYLKVQTSSTGNFEYRETANKPATTNPTPDEADLGNDVDSCPAGTAAGYSGSPISGATNPRICYQPVQNGSAKPVARLTVAGQKAEEDKRTNANNQNQDCPNGKNADGSCVENADQDAIGDCGGGAMNWIICPVIQLAKAGAEKIDSFIMKSLEVDVTGIFETDCTDPNKPCTGKAYYAAWNSFRIIATAILVVAGLVMVISQALGFDFLDAYTMRKVLPRLVIAIIGISLSWPLMRFVVEFFNVLGLDIRSLMYAPFSNLGGNIDPSVGIGTSIGLLAGGLVLGGLGLLSLIATALLAVLVGFFIIVIRQIAIVMLVVVAPVAIACYILPNTEKVWKLWKDNFLGLMLMFPIISAFIAAGHIFSAVSLADNSGGTATGANLVAQIVGIIAYFLPYFLLPLTFRIATGVIGTIAGFANDRGRGAFDRLKKYRAGKTEQSMNHYKDKYGTRIQQGRANLVRGLNDEAAGAGRVRGALLRGMGRTASGRFRNLEADMSALNARRGKELGDQIATGDDSEIRGLTVNRSAARNSVDQTLLRNGAVFESNLIRRKQQGGALEYKTLGGGWASESAVLNGQKRWGDDVAAQQAALAYEMRKASSEGELQGVAGRYQSLAKDQWRMTDTEAGGAWIGASFEHQNSHLEFKNTDWKTGQLKSNQHGIRGADFVKEVYEKRGSYNMAQMGSNTFEQLKHSYASADAVLSDQNSTAEARLAATDHKEKIAAIAETFMHEAGYGGGQVGTVGDDNIPVTAPGASRRQANTPGSAHTAERVRELAEMAGVGPSGTGPTGTYTDPSHAPSPNRREQN